MSLQASFLTGIKWTTIQQIAGALIGIVRLSILARLLEKETFGLFAVTLMIVGFSSVFSDFGISSSLYHAKNITRIQYSTLYWLNLIFSLVIYVLLVLLGPIATWYFEEPQLLHVIPILGLNLIFVTIGNHFKIYAEKELKFKELAIITIVTNAIGLILSIILALAGYEIYALIFPIMLASLASSLCFFILMFKKYKLQFVFKFNEVRSFFNIGLYQAGSRIVDFTANYIDILLIGKLLGMETLGIYNLIKEILKRLYTLTNGVITKTSIPIFSQFNSDEDLLKTRFLKLVDNVSFLTSMLYAALAVMASEILIIMYGGDFRQYDHIFAMFCFLYFLNSFGTIATVLVISKGKTQYGLYWTLFRLVFSLVFILIFGKLFGLVGVVLGLLFFGVISPPVFYHIVLKKVQPNISIKEFILSFAQSLVCGLFVFLVCSFINNLILANLPLLTSIILKSIVLLVVASGFIYFVQIEKAKFIIDLVGKYVGIKKNPVSNDIS